MKHQSGSLSDNEQYSHGHSAQTIALFARRTVEVEAAFLLPYLKPGMRLLDAGCGSGSITVGLANAVNPGEVVGVDIGEESLDYARSLAKTEGVQNIKFETGNVYELPYPDTSFDAVYSHMLLAHLAEPDKAIQEMNRVLKPGGVIGICDTDMGSRINGPASPAIERFWEIYNKFWQSTG